MEANFEEQVKLVICSVGSSPQPILYTLKTIKPKNVVFYCSTTTVDQITDILQECPFIEKHSVIETENWEDIDENLNLLYKEIPRHVNRRKVAWDEVMVDYTGGTKTMGAALVLSTVDKGVRYAYVSGNERSKEGVGIVIDGTEKLLLKSNPWNSIAYQQRKEISQAFNLRRFDEAISLAAEMKEKLSPSSPWKEIANGLIHVFIGYQEWDKFRHKQAIEKLKQGSSNLVPYRFVEKSIESFLENINENLKVLETFNSQDQVKKNQFFLEDLIANAIRRGKGEQKFDDGVARLYRALELLAQNQLLGKYEINSSKCRLDQIPESLREEYKIKYYDEKSQTLKFGLDASYRLLFALGDELGERYDNKKEEILKRLSIRNKSILAHGLQPVSENGYKEFLQVVLELSQISTDDLITFPKIKL